MKNKRTEIAAWVTIIAICFGLWHLPKVIIWLQNAEPPRILTTEQVKQQKVLEEVKQAGGSSVLLRTEKLGDDVKPLIVRHWARYTETGSVEYWTEVVK